MTVIVEDTSTPKSFLFKTICRNYDDLNKSWMNEYMINIYFQNWSSIKFLYETKMKYIIEVKRAGNFLAHELMSWAGPFQVVSWAEPSWNRFSIWWAELSWAFSDFEFGELSWAELSSSWTSQKTSSNWNPKFRYGELNELDSVTTTGVSNYLDNWHF